MNNILSEVAPEIAAEWHPTKNGDLTPADVTYGSGRKVWWKCKQGHEWQIRISNRTNNHNDCPYCANRKLLAGYNDLQSKFPEIAAEWHPTKNGDLTPADVTYGSGKRGWWQCKQGHEWQTQISYRTKKQKKCPVCKQKPN